MTAENSFVLLSVSRDWELHRKGPADERRHRAKVKEAIKDNLAEIVAEEAIITSDGKRIIKVPIRGLELPRFRYDPNKEKGVGADEGKNVGDVIGHVPDQSKGGKGKGRGGAGNEPGIDYYEAEITVDDLAELVFQDLNLPNLKPKAQQELLTADIEFKEVGRRGPMSNLEKKRTVLETIRRNAMAGKPPRFEGIRQEDLRFRIWTPDVRKENNAVVIAMRDISGSMGEFEKYISRSFYFWMVRFLRTKYNNVRIVFITHHTEAKEVTEEAFFNLGESGGTRVSSAYQLALDIVRERFDPGRWNIYPFHFSDGDNWGEADNKLCLELVEEFLKFCNQFGYGEIREIPMLTLSTLMSAFSAIQNPRFAGVTISQRQDVYPALQKFFGKEHIEGAVSRV